MKLAIAIILLLPTLALADGVNKKKVRHKSRPKVVVKQKVTTRPKVPTLLETKYDLAMTPTLRPTLPLLDIPTVPVQPFVETELRVFEIEQKKDRKGLWFLIGGGIAAGAIAILLDHDTPLTPTPQPTPNVPVPESKTIVLLGLGLLGLKIRRSRQ